VSGGRAGAARELALGLCGSGRTVSIVHRPVLSAGVFGLLGPVGSEVVSDPVVSLRGYEGCFGYGIGT
jgi:hypothetical protein